MTIIPLTTPFRRLKWGFLPRRRVLPEELEGATAEDNASVALAEKQFEDNLDFGQTNQWEYRDEKGRKWWKFFDEYEYRVTSKTKKQKKWYHWFHDSDTAAERRVILKIDLFLTFYSLAAYWIKYLDQTNITNAYVGGMKEAIGMEGNDFVHVQVMYTVGCVIFQIPFMYILYGLPLNYVLPAIDICWSILTVAMSRVTNVGQLKVLRFFVGGFEASSYIAFHALFASWFKSSTGEVARRAGFYYMGQFLGILTSGLLSGAIEDHLQGFNGKDAWQWIFIIDGIVSIVVGVLGIYMIPGTPENCYSIFFTDEEIRIARRRMKADQKSTTPIDDPTKYFFNLKIWKSIFTSWRIYVLVLWDVFCWNNSNGGSGAYALWLKSLTNDEGKPRFGAGQLQNFTSLTPALGLLWVTSTSAFADMFASRWGAIIFSQVFNVLGNILLAVWHIPEAAKWFAWSLQYFGWAMAPTLYSWQGDICRRDIRERQIVLVAMNMVAQSSTAWTSVLVWKTVEAPRFLKGYSFTAASGLALCLWTFVVLYYYKRDERAHARENGIILYNSETDPEFAAKMIEQKNGDGASQSDSEIENIGESVDEKK